MKQKSRVVRIGYLCLHCNDIQITKLEIVETEGID
jgi:hypothetical protein